MVQKVTFLGNKHIKPEELQNITDVRSSTPLNPNLNRQGCQKILEKYAEEGRSFAYCQLVKGGDLADTEVIYRITEGPKSRCATSNSLAIFFVSSNRLLTKITRRASGFVSSAAPTTSRWRRATLASCQILSRLWLSGCARLAGDAAFAGRRRSDAYLPHSRRPALRIQNVPDVMAARRSPASS